MGIPSFVDLMKRSVEAYLLALTSWIDPDVTKYTVKDLIPYDCNVGRISVFSSDEYSSLSISRLMASVVANLSSRVSSILLRRLLVVKQSISNTMAIQRHLAMTSRASLRPSLCWDSMLHLRFEVLRTCKERRVISKIIFKGRTCSCL